MLSEVLKRAKLTQQEKTALEDIWDKLHRHGSLTTKQKAWVERVYFGQKLDRAPAKGVPAAAKGIPAKPFDRKKSGTFLGAAAQARQHRIGYINWSGTQQVLLITNMSTLRELCPTIKPGSKQYQKIELFFKNGGEVLKIKPALARTG